MKKYHFKDAFIEAESFFAAHNYISDKAFDKIEFSDTVRFMGICRAMEVNHVFAIEMFLKCLSLIKTNHYKGGHDLVSLFKHLAPKIQNEIITHYDENYKSVDEESILVLIGKCPPGFTELLEQSKDYFLESRYIFSRENRYKFYKLRYVLITLRDMCIKYKPELNEEVFALN